MILVAALVCVVCSKTWTQHISVLVCLVLARERVTAVILAAAVEWMLCVARHGQQVSVLLCPPRREARDV